MDHLGVAQHALRNAGDDQPPGLAIVGGLVDPGIAVVLLVSIHGQICGGGVVARRRDAPHRAPDREQGADLVRLLQVVLLSRVNCTCPSLVPTQIIPFSMGDSAMPKTTPAYSTPMLSPVRPPELPMRVRSLSVRSGEMTCQLWPPSWVRWTCWLPVDGVVVRRNVKRRVPHKPVSPLPRVRWIDGARLRHSGTGAGSPQRTTISPTLPDLDAVDHTMLGSWDPGGPAAFTATDRVPHSAADSGAPRPAPGCCWATIAGLVLLVAEHVVRDRVVDRDVVDLRIGESLPEPGPAPVLRDRKTLGRARRSCGRGCVIDPDVVVAAGAAVAALDLERDPPSIDLE